MAIMKEELLKGSPEEQNVKLKECKNQETKYIKRIISDRQK